MDERTRRIGENEALFREVNERVGELDDRFGGSASFDIVCECGNDSCFERIAITKRDYAELRSDATTFAVVPGHELTDVESVVEEHDGYNVVRKRPGEPARIAEAAYDPDDGG